MSTSSEQRGLRQLDPAIALLEAMVRVFGGIPFFFLAIPLGYMAGSGRTSLSRVIFYLPFMLLGNVSGFICVPLLALSLVLLIRSEFPRTALIFVAFTACAWTGYVEDQADDLVRGILLGLGTVLGYLFLVRPHLHRGRV